MKKSLIALAAFAATGAAMAQSSVTLYGVVDTSFGYVKGQDSVHGLLNNGASTSRLGFKGVEDLGNGLKAEFVLEGAISPDDGSAGRNGGFDFKRQSTLGLSGDFGTVRFGRELSASYKAVSRYDVFNTNGLGSTLAWGDDANDYNNRHDNMVSYYTPTFSGFGVGVNYAFGEQSENRTNRYYGVAATYDNGPISLGLGYERKNNQTSTADMKTWQLGGSYNFEIVKLAAFYSEHKLSAIQGGGSGDKFKAYNIGLSAPVGAAGEAKIAYNHYKQNDAKANQLSLGYVQNLSKRTAVYGTYAYLKNKNGGNLIGNLEGAFSAAGLKNGKQQGFQVGVKHSF